MLIKDMIWESETQITMTHDKPFPTFDKKPTKFNSRALNDGDLVRRGNDSG